MRRKLTTKEFIEKAEKKHSTEYYDYSFVKYVNNITKIIIICNEIGENGNIHGKFEQTPSNHLFGQGCPKCYGRRLLTKEEFIANAIQAHGDLYDYSKSKYINNCTKLVIICKKHGEFLQRPNDHMNSHQQGCPKCGKENTANKLKSNVVDFIKKANKIYNNRYDYIKFNYKNYNTKGTIICNKLDKHGNKHGEFLQAPSNHLLGKEGCQKCFSNMTHLYQLGNINDFIKKANKIHNNKYDYSKFEYITARIKSIIICPEHGEFSCSPDNHQRDKGCPICNESKGEKRIRIFLQSNNIKFTRQKTFIDCINKKLRFDFYLDNYNICMEFDGIQHFKPIKFNSISDREAIKNFKKLKTLDKIKNRYCKNKNISLIRIPYTEIDRIEEIISDILKI